MKQALIRFAAGTGLSTCLLLAACGLKEEAAPASASAPAPAPAPAPAAAPPPRADRGGDGDAEAAARAAAQAAAARDRQAGEEAAKARREDQAAARARREATAAMERERRARMSGERAMPPAARNGGGRSPASAGAEAPAAVAPAPAPPPPAIVYNADLAPQLTRDADAPRRPVVKAGQPFTLRFDIGPPWASSILAPTAPAAAILDSKGDVPLSVILVCAFCQPSGEALKHVTYMPDQGRSNEVQFKLTPSIDPNRPSYVGSLQLLIINDRTGVEHDRLGVEIGVRDDGAALSRAGPGAAAISASTPAGTATWQPDVVLYVNQEVGTDISMEVQPISPQVRAAIGPLAFDQAGRRRKLMTGINDANLVEAMTRSSYGVMTALSEQGLLLRQLSARGTDAAVSAESLKTLTLKDGESLKVTSALGDIGRRLYRNLFVDGGADGYLVEIMERLDAIAAAQPPARPLRMKVVTNRISLPWQYLHPVGPDLDARRFWGLRYSLSVVRANSHTVHNAVAAAGGGAGKVVYARYASSADDTWKLADDQIRQLKGIPLDLLEVDSSTRLLNTLKAERAQIGAILTFLHASSGARAGTPASLLAQPELLFNDGDIVTSYRLGDLRNVLTAEEARSLYLRRAPLVILNACETGPSMALPHVTLQDAMFQLGARGVVVTEVSVWVQLGHEVATRLIERLARGEAISDALTAIRRELYAGRKNPLGLLYVYYGDPAATLRH